MENDKLLKLLEDHTMTDEEAVGMIFSNFIDIGGTLVGLTVENAIKAGALLREYDKRSSSRSRNDLQDSSRIKTRMAHERVSLNPGNGPSV